MAKRGSIVQAIKAKPGNRPPNYGKYANVPMPCNTKGCENEAIVHTGSFATRHKWCWACYGNAPNSASDLNKRHKAATAFLASIGVTLK